MKVKLTIGGLMKSMLALVLIALTTSAQISHAGLPLERCSASESFCKSIDAANSVEEYRQVLAQIDTLAAQSAKANDLELILHACRAYRYFSISATGWRPEGYRSISYEHFLATAIPNMKELSTAALKNCTQLIGMFEFKN